MMGIGKNVSFSWLYKSHDDTLCIPSRYVLAFNRVDITYAVEVR